MQELSCEGSVFRVRTRVSTGRYAWCMGRINLKATSSRAKTQGSKTNKADPCADVGKLMEATICEASLCSCIKKKILPTQPVCGEKLDDFED